MHMGLLRVLLAISVFMAHSGNSGLMAIFMGFGGRNAVEIFFIISGFYIALILDKTYKDKLSFYKNRILRLYPIYYVICLLILIRALILPSFWENLFSFPGKALAFGVVSNTTFFGGDWLYFLQWHDGSFHFGNFNNSEFILNNMLLVPQSWSLGIEITFYLFAPFFCKARTQTVLFFTIGLLTTRFLGIYLGLDHDSWSFRFFPFELPLFLLGILIYRLKQKKIFHRSMSKFRAYVFLIISYLLFPVLTKYILINQLLQLIVLVSMTFIVMIKVEENGKDRRLGELSYPFYMSHIFVISTYAGTVNQISKIFPELTVIKNPIFAIPIMLFIVLTLSYILLKLTQPIEKIRDRSRK